jgi:hypothetical protein
VDDALARRGFVFTSEELSARYNRRLPEPGEQILQPAPAMPPTPAANAAPSSALSKANAQVSTAAADQYAAIQDAIMRDWFAHFEEIATQAKTEEEFLGALEAACDRMPEELLTRANVERLAAPFEGASGAAIVNTLAERAAKERDA